MTEKPPKPWADLPDVTKKDIVDALKEISPLTLNNRRRVGQIIFNQNWDRGFELWDSWSGGKGTAEEWAQFHITKLGIGTLIEMARGRAGVEPAPVWDPAPALADPLVNLVANAFQQKYGIDLRQDQLALYALKEEVDTAQKELRADSSYAFISRPFISGVDSSKHLVAMIWRYKGGHFQVYIDETPPVD